MSSSNGGSHRRVALPQQNRDISISIAHGPSAPPASGQNCHIAACLSKCRSLLGDLEITAVSLEQLLLENQWTKAAIDTELLDLKKLLEDYNVTHLELMRICETTDTDSKPFLDRRQRFLIRYKAIRNLLIAHLDGNPSSNQAQSTSDATGLRLPKVEIPIFDGDHDQWLGWYNLFESLINNNTTLKPMSKLSYLRSLLKGPPLTLAQGYPFEDTYYQAAYKAVVDHYNDPLRRISRLLNQLQDMPAVKDKKQTLRGLISSFRATSTSLQIMFSENPRVDPLSQMLIHAFLSKADKGTRQDWEREVMRRQGFASVEEFITYMEGRCNAYERATAGTSSQATTSQHSSHSTKVNSKKSSVCATTLKKSMKCYHCKGDHTIYKCSDFPNLSIQDRQKYIREKDWCSKCISPKCNKKCAAFCRICKKSHNLLIHDDQHAANREANQNKSKSGKSKFEFPFENKNQNTDQIADAPCLGLWIGNVSQDFSEALLATAEIQISNISKKGKTYCCRALIDSASQSNLITSPVAKKLDLSPFSTGCSLGSIQGHQSFTHGSVKASISAKSSQFTLETVFEIVDEIVDLVPQNTFSISHWKIPKNLRLADPQFNISAGVDVLLGLRIFWKILGSHQIRLKNHLPCLRSSALGWLVTDDRLEELPQPIVTTKRIFAIHSCDTLSSTFQKFWLLDEFNSEALTFEEIECEKSFKQTAARTLTTPTSGYFTVFLPFKVAANKLGQSREIALRQFYSLERRLAKNPLLKAQYAIGMNDYITLKHMVEIDDTDSNDKANELAYYMPHHAVIKETSTSTKLRNVFNASSPTSSGLSLNDCLMVGPVVQSDLLTVILRFRLHKIVFTADIIKMYRQVRLCEEHTRFQRILWRSDPTEALKTYEIITLAFGTASAPFLATRCLKALVELDGAIFPKACPVVLRDFYVDDVLTGADTIQEAQETQTQLREMLNRGGFTLSKWCSNNQKLIDNIPEDQRESSFPFSLDKEDKIIKTLGILWSSTNDTYQIKVNLGEYEKAKSKRHILSIIASIFDPLGIIAPVTITAKLLIQSLWTETQTSCSSKKGEHWDETISPPLFDLWKKFASTLHELHDVAIQRYIFFKCEQRKRVEIHAFSDASQIAYGAVVYIRVLGDNNSSSSVYYAKSRVAPIKKQTIPRLELCAALLMTEIVDKVKSALDGLIHFDLIRFWTDSQIVLHWISSPPARWLPFVANRVLKIQKSNNSGTWDYVQSKANPADLISRGVPPAELKVSSLWWEGPDWLQTNEPFSETANFVPSTKATDLELRRSKRSLTFVSTIKSTIFAISARFWRLVRLVAWITRFAFNAHCFGPYFTGPLQTIELNEAIFTLVKIAQTEHFSTEIKQLENNLSVDKNSALSSLDPFLDNHNLIRVGGRLEFSDLSYDKRYPIVLHPKHELSVSIIKHYHEKHLHAGPQLLRSIIRARFWVLRINSAIRHCILNCPKCIRMRAETRHQTMATLPRNRVTPARPFLFTGVDYAGPFLILSKPGRNPVKVKAYIALFVCFTTKAIHLEMVSDMTSNAFIVALHRFVSRRGSPKEILSDNGTNFVGAKNLLKKDFQKLLSSHSSLITAFASKQGCDWHFIPPYSPHFGGLWEAGVKSVKSHLKFILGKHPFTFEQWVTALTQIKACLNSRPLMVDSTDPNEPGVLTPGHFLIGEPLVGIPSPDLSEVPHNRLKHWERVQAQTQRFWKRWRAEYLNTLQQRSKWRLQKDNIQVNDMVILKEDNTPPTLWPLGRIVQTHPGSDGLVRVVSVRTEDGIIKRPLVKIILLPTNENSLISENEKSEVK